MADGERAAGGMGRVFWDKPTQIGVERQGSTVERDAHLASVRPPGDRREKRWPCAVGEGRKVTLFL